MYYDLPEGLTEEKLSEWATEEKLRGWAKEYQNAARRKSYARHPERVMRQRLKSAVNLLARHGLIDDQAHASILSAIDDSLVASIVKGVYA